MESVLKSNPLTVLKIPNCGNCSKMCALFDEIDATPYSLIDISELDSISFDEVMDYLEAVTNTRTFPMVFVNGRYIGDYKEVVRKHEVGLLQEILLKELQMETSAFDF